MIRVDYAGPGGACEGIRSLGLSPVGIEWDAAACATRAAAGHLTIRADLAHYRTPGARVGGYWASPPCQSFSTAGKGEGREQIDALSQAILAEDWSATARFDSRTRHVLDAASTAVELAPEWIAMEQVPAVLPLWRALAHVLERHGYSAWAGVLCAADYGVPQTRRRAILMASRTRSVQPPPITHAEHPGMFGEAPWVSMADALGWEQGGTVEHQRGRGMAERHGERSPRSTDLPAPTITAGANRRLVLDRRQQTDGPDGTRVPVPPVSLDRPAPTLTGIAGSKGQWVIRTENFTSAKRGDTWQDRRYERAIGEPSPTVGSRFDQWEIAQSCHHDERSQVARPVDASDVAAGVDPGERPIRLTVPDALIIQSFDPSYPVQGSRSKQFEQVGNAVPPLLAAHVVAALTGRQVPS